MEKVFSDPLRFACLCLHLRAYACYDLFSVPQACGYLRTPRGWRHSRLRQSNRASRYGRSLIRRRRATPYLCPLPMRRIWDLWRSRKRPLLGLTQSEWRYPLSPCLLFLIRPALPLPFSLEVLSPPLLHLPLLILIQGFNRSSSASNCG